VRSKDWGRVLNVLAINYVASTLTCPIRLVDGTGYIEARDRAVVALLLDDQYAQRLSRPMVSVLAGS